MLAAAAQKACENRKHITDYAASCETRNKLVLLSRYAYGGGCALHILLQDVPCTYIIALHRYARIVHASTPTPLCDG